MKKVIILILILTLLIPIISLAQDEYEENFIISDNYEVVSGDTLTITIDFNKIPYDEFVFTLNSNLDLNNIDIENDELEAEIEENELEINIDKANTNLTSINLLYKIPENIEVGTNIEFIGKIADKNSEDYMENTINILVVEEIFEKTEEPEGIDKEENKEEIYPDKDDMQNNNQKENNNTMINKNNNQEEVTTRTESISGKTIGNSNLSNQESQSVTYNGESNNYLSSLEIDGFDLLPNFSKTCQTYFIEVGNDVNSITINAEAEDENAKVTLYGNENLQEGENKVLVSVTAENGSVRFYRIYVTKNS